MIDLNILQYKNLEPLNVSRETFPKFEAFCELLKKENSKINLISKSTEKEIRKRHIIDLRKPLNLLMKITIFAQTLDQDQDFQA